MHPLRATFRRLVGRPVAAPVLLALAFVALTCRNNTTFHLMAEGEAAVAHDAAPTAVAFAALTAMDLAKHNTLQRQGLAAADLSSVKPYAATLSVTQPATAQDVTFLQQVTVVARAPNLPDVVVADGAAFAGGSNSVGLNVHDVELRRYAHTRQLTYALQVDAGTAPPQDVQLALTVVLDVDVAQPKGACN